MVILRRIKSKRRHKKMLNLVARMSGDLSFLDKLLTDRKKTWADVEREVLGIKNKIEVIIRGNNCQKNSYNQRLCSFANYVSDECDGIISRHGKNQANNNP